MKYNYRTAISFRAVIIGSAESHQYFPNYMGKGRGGKGEVGALTLSSILPNRFFVDR